MTSERWAQIKNLLDAALSAPRDDRPRFVADHAAGDEELRREVLSLLASHDEAGDFLEDSAIERPGGRAPAADLAGSRVGAYRLVREIGRGGMGTVYLAVRADNEFRKQVAVKLISGGLENAFVIGRFRNERQILARLEHPNIARLVDGGTTEDGLPYFIMEYVEGEPLLQYCESRSLPLPDRIAIFQRVCSAVQYAHRRMIIHRDLKPGNVLVKKDGTPKLLDFGIAKILDPERGDPGAETTLAGCRLITPAYSSPEQIRGEPATVRSDIYSLGIVLWELVAGRAGPGAGRRTFELPEEYERETSWRLARSVRNIVLKAAGEKPEERYASVEALGADLERAAGGGEITLDVAAGAGAESAAPERGSIAVLPFQLLGAGAAESYLGLGIADAVISRLSNIGRVAVRPTSAVMKYASGGDAAQAARELRVAYVLEGLVQKFEGRVRVTVQLMEGEARAPLWSAGFEEKLQDLLRMEDSIAAQVALALVPQMRGEEPDGEGRPGTANARAHEAYLRGRWHWNQHTEEALPQALVLFTEAVNEDPGYAQAHAGIADYHIALAMRCLLPPAEAFAAGIAAAHTAIGIDPEQAEAHASLGLALWVRDRDYETAAHHLQLAIALSPEYASAHDRFGLMNAAHGEPVIAQALIERARRLDPHSSVYAADLGMLYYCRRNYAQALASFGAPAGPEGDPPPDAPPVINGAVLPLTLLAMAQTETALAAAERYSYVTGRSTFALGVLALAAAATGDELRAWDVLAELESRARDYYVPGTALAIAYLACGQRENALRELERGCRDREWWTLYLAQMPLWDGLRDHPRFLRLCSAGVLPVHRAAPPAPSARPSRRWAALAAVVALAALLTFGWMRTRTARVPLENPRISRLTTNGLAERVAVSPDGVRVAYSIRRAGKASIWVRNRQDGSSHQVAGPFEGLVPSLQFTRRGADVAFVVLPVNDPHGGALYVVPAAGGAVRLALAGMAVPVAVSQDENEFAYYGRDPRKGDVLLLRNASGAEQPLNSRPAPQVFVGRPAPVFSPDGQEIACGVAGPWPAGYGIRLEIVRRDGSARTLGDQVWQSVSDIAWLEGGRGLVIAAQDRDSPMQQIWHLSRDGRASRITDDLSTYDAVGAAAGGAALVAVQAQTITNLYVQKAGDPDHPVQITPGAGRYFDVAWTPAGDLLYASDATGSAEIWTMDAAGNGQRRITSGPARNYAPAISPDGRTVAFHSNQGGVWNIWTAGPDGDRPAQLTRDRSDSQYPQFTPDGTAVLYQHVGPNALCTVWRMPLSGGVPAQLTTFASMYPTASGDGRLAYWFTESADEPSWKIAITRPGNAAPERFFSFPSNRMPNVTLRWVPGRDAVSYSENRDGVSNIWIQPVSGGPAAQATNSTPGRIYSFDWSRDGRLVYSRGMTTSDVVLLEARSR